MSNVIDLRPERTGRTAVHRPDGGAEILFFTGIRYMREESSAAPTATELQPVAPSPAEAFAIERLKA